MTVRTVKECFESKNIDFSTFVEKKWISPSKQLKIQKILTTLMLYKILCMRSRYVFSMGKMFYFVSKIHCEALKTLKP